MERLHHVDKTAQLFNELKKLGVRIAIDNFGAGYTLLAKMNDLPIKTLKIDQSVIHNIADNVKYQVVLEAIMAMGKSLNLTIAATGVETQEQERFLRNYACDEMQGFRVSKPVGPSEFLELFCPPNSLKD